MKELLLKCRGAVFLASTLKIVVSLCLALTTYLTAGLLDFAVAGNGRGVLLQALCLLSAYGISLVMDYLADVSVARAVKQLNQALREKMLVAITNMSYVDYADEESGKYVSWLSNDVTQIETNAFQTLFFILGNMATIIFSIIGLCYIHYSVLIMALVFSAFMFLLPKVVGRLMEQKSQEVSNAQEAFVSKTKDYLSGFDVLSSFNVLNQLIIKIGKQSNELEQTRFEFKKYQAKSMQLIDTGRVVFQITMIVLTSFLVVVKVTTIGVIFPVTEYAGSLFAAISGLINRLMLIKSAKPLFEKYKINATEVKSPIGEFKDAITFNQVFFAYGNQQVFSNLNLRFEKGKKYAIIGASGSGKTTLVKLLMNHLVGWNGEILVDSEAIQNIEPSHLISYIGQNVHLFSESLIDNITLFQPFSEQQCTDAIKQSSLEEVIERFTDQEKIMLYENGSNLSGGQKQRIAVARALIRQKPIIILDEGTSALDKENAHEIESKLLGNQALTLIMITHHLQDDLRSLYDEVIDLDKLSR